MTGRKQLTLLILHRRQNTGAMYQQKQTDGGWSLAQTTDFFQLLISIKIWLAVFLTIFSPIIRSKILAYLQDCPYEYGSCVNLWTYKPLNSKTYNVHLYLAGMTVVLHKHTVTSHVENVLCLHKISHTCCRKMPGWFLTACWIRVCGYIIFSICTMHYC